MLRFPEAFLRCGLPLLLVWACQTRAPKESVAPPLEELLPASNSVTQPAVEPEAAPDAPLRPASEVTWSFASSPFGRIDVVIRVPAHREGARLPSLITFHGRGESLKGPSRGARGWLDDYDLALAAERLAAPPLSQKDFQGFITEERLARINADLAQRAYHDLVVVMPYLPDVLRRDEVFDNGPKLAEFVTRELLPRLSSELPISTEPASRGLDGVSLGGRAALIIGFTEPKMFGTLGALQPALDNEELPHFAALAESALRLNPALKLRLLTSHEDYYREVVNDFAALLRERGVRHRLELVSGDHSYEFNRGPGAIEMLLFHSRELHSKRRAQ